MIVADATEAGRVDLQWHPHISVWMVMVTLVVTYWYVLVRIGPRVVGPDEPVVTRRQLGWLIGGFAGMYVFAEYPIHDISERYLFFVHMLQHTAFTLVAPACLLLGTPAWLQRRILAVRPIGFSINTCLPSNRHIFILIVGCRMVQPSTPNEVGAGLEL